MDNNRFEKQLNFILEIDKEKNILRQTHITGNSRQENDAEHAWHMAIMIYLLKEYANEDFDIAKAVLMALIHDVVEIDAGDSYAYDPAALATQAAREEAAAKRLFGMLPDDQSQYFKDLFEEYEECQTPEARFVRAMDNVQPLLLNDSNDGGDWITHNVGLNAVMKRQDRTKPGSDFLYEFSKQIVLKNVEKGAIKPE